MNWRERVTINPEICHGKACIKGTRLMVSIILNNLAEEESYESIISGYHVTKEDIQAAIAYAADLAEERHVSLEQEVR
jgi:uncharacterized protein (DUF433 family)